MDYPFLFPSYLRPSAAEMARRRRGAIRSLAASVAGLLILAVALALTVSCASGGGTSTAPAIHQGAANATDSQIYDSLLSVQASLEQAKVSFGADPRAKDSLNRAITAYNAAQDAYKSWHAIAASGGVAPDPVTLQAQIAQLVTDLATIQATYGHGKGSGTAALSGHSRTVIRDPGWPSSASRIVTLTVCRPEPGGCGR